MDVRRTKIGCRGASQPVEFGIATQDVGLKLPPDQLWPTPITAHRTTNGDGTTHRPERTSSLRVRGVPSGSHWIGWGTVAPAVGASATNGRSPMDSSMSTALVAIDRCFADAEELALAGFLAGYRGSTRDAYTLDLRHGSRGGDPGRGVHDDGSRSCGVRHARGESSLGRCSRTAQHEPHRRNKGDARRPDTHRRCPALSPNPPRLAHRPQQPRRSPITADPRSCLQYRTSRRNDAPTDGQHAHSGTSGALDGRYVLPEAHA